MISQNIKTHKHRYHPSRYFGMDDGTDYQDYCARMKTAKQIWKNIGQTVKHRVILEDQIFLQEKRDG